MLSKAIGIEIDYNTKYNDYNTCKEQQEVTDK